MNVFKLYSNTQLNYNENSLDYLVSDSGYIFSIWRTYIPFISGINIGLLY
jgi:hypothetical protein